MLRKVLALIVACGLTLTLTLAGQAPAANKMMFSGGYVPHVYTDFTQLQGLAPPASGTPANWPLPASNYTYSGPSLRTITDATGAITYAPNNLLRQSNTFSNAIWNSYPDVSSGVTDPFGGSNASTFTASTNGEVLYLQLTLQAGANFANQLWIRRRTGMGSVVFRDLNNSDVTTSVTSTWTKFTRLVTSSGSGNYFALYLATAGDAVDIYQGVASAVTYETSPRPGDQVVTTSAAYYGPAFDYNPVTLAPLGLRVEEVRTNLFLNSGSPATQTITVASGSAYSISFYGTGVLTLSGALTQVMTGSAYPTRTTYTGTTSTTSLVATVTSLGTMTYPQVELGAFPTSAIPSGASTVTRAAEVVGIVGPALTVLHGGAASVIAETVLESAINNNWAVVGTNNSTVAMFWNNGIRAGLSNQTQTQIITTPSSLTLTNTQRYGAMWSPSGRSVVNSGVGLTSDANTNVFSLPMFVGYNGTSFLDGHIRKLALYNVAIPAAILQRNTLLTTVLH